MKLLSLIAISVFQLAWPQSALVEGATNRCEPLRPGESIRVHQEGFESPTGLARLYDIERDSTEENIYHLYVPLELLVQDNSVSENYLGETSTNYLSPNDVLEHIAGSENIDPVEAKNYEMGNSAMAQFMAAQEVEAILFVRAQRCLQNSHGRIIGPDGEDLRLYARTLSYMGIENSNENLIRISPAPHRSVSTNWAENIDCNAILHEVLHLLGLVDGYEEHDPAYGSQCRHLEPRESIMNTADVLGPFYDFVTCQKDTTQENSPLMINMGLDAEISCDTIGKNYTGSREEMIRVQENTGFTIRYSERSVPPILQRAHIRFITKPLCNEENEQYITCSQNAYQSEADGCYETPAYCSDGSYLNE